MCQVRQEELHAFAAVAAVVRVFVDVDDDESGNRKLGDGLNQVSAPFVAAAVPVELGFADAQAFHGLAHVGNVVVFAQYGGKKVGARVQVRA